MFEDKNRVLENANIDSQKRLDSLEVRMGNIEKMIKNMAEWNSNILKTVVDNDSKLLKKVEQDKGHDSPIVTNNQGPSKNTRAHSRKARDASRVEEMKATIENMHILVD